MSFYFPAFNTSSLQLTNLGFASYLRELMFSKCKSLSDHIIESVWQIRLGESYFLRIRWPAHPIPTPTPPQPPPTHSCSPLFKEKAELMQQRRCCSGGNGLYHCYPWAGGGGVQRCLVYWQPSAPVWARQSASSCVPWRHIQHLKKKNLYFHAEASLSAHSPILGPHVGSPC